MSQDSWNENDELDPIGSLLSEWSNDDFENDFFFQGLEGRRRKAAVVLTMIWGGTIALHLVSWGSWLIVGLTALLGIQAVRIVLARPLKTPKLLSDTDQENFPFVSLLVAAKNEEAVISHLVKMLCNLDYPKTRYEVWVINDHSTDQTPILLEQLAAEYDQLKVLHRGADAGGGKSGALNQVLPLTQGEIVGVFDADAKVSKDLLRRVLPLFRQPKMGAVQMRKAIANASENFWTRGQMAEMAFDSYIQQHRIAIGGIGELRGNGQFVRRVALERCGGWNEQTITDDLDLTIRLHLDKWDIGFLNFPPVEEEGVTSALALWHQRNRWGEGGYQRYLDYWRLIASNRMGTSKTLDLFSFMIIQYLLPAAAIPDCLMAIARNRPPILTPLTGLTVTLPLLGMFIGLRRIHKDQPLTASTFFVTLLQTLRGTFYMFHWMLVIAGMTARISVRPKRLKWVKTTHQGTGEGEESFEF
ncbi:MULTISPECIES: glycosyltransferase [unclassified Coleofasciculus]|uniref:glycosyltransferase n=1 Tax=unclassified Coleofasciculus TaxID=2692782 RepID=UPI001880FBEA|nr:MULTISPECIES: glycosyltransferase family 2 protein [unclassified Coleofasciculus]MBE9125117.1 glycosyltransferase family 2 protein [Coleofasciculus sp. LEGE 07081]MBE9148334.1 glycosyltransferase family 2 protein [Coleofasciculus sp. LEGE 07092]